MNLNPMKWFRADTAVTGGKRLQGQPMTAREAETMGPWTQTLTDWVAREVAPALYEALREAIPVLDAAINRLVTLDGIIRVEGQNDRIVQAIQQWMEDVRVGDMEQGFQAFYSGMGNELYEQGFAVGNHVLSQDRKAVVQLLVADSKGVAFRRGDQGLEVWYSLPGPKSGRRDGTDQVERVLRNSYQTGTLLQYLQGNGYRMLNRETLVYAGLHNEAGNPYGVSLIRSMEFVSRVLLTMDNALLQTWERFGNPVFDVLYKTKSKGVDLDKRRKTLGDNLKAAMESKRKGNAVDFINAVGSGDDLTIRVLGADGQVLEIEAPAKHVLEQIVAKTGLPPWVLGYVWGTAERLALKQAELLGQESRTRFSLRKPWLKQVVATHLRAQGITWKDGDWDLVQELPNLQDIVGQAQAEFLQAQTQMMLTGAGVTETMPAKVSRLGKVILPLDDDLPRDRESGGGEKASRRKAPADGEDDGEPFAEADDALPTLERRATRALLQAWGGLYGEVLSILGIEDSGKALKQDGPFFAFDPAPMLDKLRALEEAFVQRAGGEESEYARDVYKTWLRGVLNAAAELDVDAIAEAVRASRQAAINSHAMDMVRSVTIRALREDVIADLGSGVYDGLNPNDVARELRKRFDAHEYDWLRLARSEMTAAQAQGKVDQYVEAGIEKYNYVTAGDSRVSSICRSNSADGPYVIGEGPMPMTDSHPNCRCTITAVID